MDRDERCLKVVTAVVFLVAITIPSIVMLRRWTAGAPPDPRGPEEYYGAVLECWKEANVEDTHGKMERLAECRHLCESGLRSLSESTTDTKRDDQIESSLVMLKVICERRMVETRTSHEGDRR